MENPTSNPAPGGARPRVLLIASKNPPAHLAGGLDMAIDVVAQLQRHGWEIDMLLSAAEDDFHAGAKTCPPDALRLPSTVRRRRCWSACGDRAFPR